MTFRSPDDLVPFTRPHRATGRPKGAWGNQNRFVHGRRSAEFIEGRKAMMELMRRCREAVEQA